MQRERHLLSSRGSFPYWHRGYGPYGRGKGPRAVTQDGGILTGVRAGNSPTPIIGFGSLRWQHFLLVVSCMKKRPPVGDKSASEWGQGLGRKGAVLVLGAL
jgi:hypothetical protein